MQDFDGENTLVVIDPVLGDDGALYDTMDQKMVRRMQRLIGKADIITPNMTEVKLLLNLPPDANLFAEHLPHLLPMLAAKGPENIVVTGVHKKAGAVVFVIITKLISNINKLIIPSCQFLIQVPATFLPQY